jgi:hypothetical protein
MPSMIDSRIPGRRRGQAQVKRESSRVAIDQGPQLFLGLARIS